MSQVDELKDKRAIDYPQRKNKWSPLMLALEFGAMAIFDYLLYLEADVNQLDGRRVSLLHYALNAREEIYAVKVLKTGRVNPLTVQITGPDGHTCFDLAAEKGYDQTCSLLKELIGQRDGGVVEQIKDPAAAATQLQLQV